MNAMSVSIRVVMCALTVAQLHPVAARAADNADASDTLAEIVVTAEKRESTVQKTPLSITAVSSQQMIEQGMSRLEDIAATTPGISMKQFSPGQTEYEMRGLPSAGGSSATVGLYLNDVPLSASANSYNDKAAVDPDLFDLQRVEILRGPQGTLYGAGSMGGTIRLITAPPDLSKFEGASQTGMSGTEHGGFNWGQSVMINLPITDNVLAVRLVGTDKYNDGWIDRIVVNPFPIGPGGACGWTTCTRGDVTSAPVVAKHDDSNWERLSGGRASVRYQPTDALTVDFMAMYQGLRLGGFPQVDASVGIDALSTYSPVDESLGFNDTFKLTSLSINYDMGFAKLTSSTGNFIHQSSWTVDFSELSEYLMNYYYGLKSFYPVPFTNSDRTQQFSEEIRLTSQGPGAFQWVGGLFYSDLKSRVSQFGGNPAFASVATGGPSADPNGVVVTDNLPYHMQQYAVFAEGSYLITDAWKATVGARGFRYQSGLDYSQAGIFSQSGNLTPTTGSVTTSASGFNPKVNLSYEPTQNLTWYAQIAKGFRPGGVNVPAPASLCPKVGPISYDPDSIWNYEVGEKARLAGGRVTINADVYYIRWNNLQQLLTLPCSYPFTDNIGKAESYGPELEMTARVVEDITLSLAGSYTTARITSINPQLLGTTLGATEALSPGIPVLNVPRYEVTAAVDFSHPVSDRFKATARLSATVTGTSHDIDYYVQQLPGYTLINARIGLVGGPWAIYAFANNLADKIAILTIDTHPYTVPTPALSQPSVSTPRTVGLEVNYKF
jgi:outer membrane receptor protein involved in Fe transport